MTVRKGFYRHYKGEVYYVYGVVCLKHEGDRRIVSYTSVKTEEGPAAPYRSPGDGGAYDFLGRDEQDFEAWVDPFQTTPELRTVSLARLLEYEDEAALRAAGMVRRFERITDPRYSVVGKP